MVKKVSRKKVLLSIFMAILAYAVFQYVFIACTQAVPPVCKPWFGYFANIFFGIIIGVVTYLVYSLFQKK